MLTTQSRTELVRRRRKRMVVESGTSSATCRASQTHLQAGIRGGRGRGQALGLPWQRQRVGREPWGAQPQGLLELGGGGEEDADPGHLS